MQNKKGFTLIELLVVIAIIGILSAIVLASLNSARTKATDAKTQGQMASIRAAAEIAYNGSNYGTAGSANDCGTLVTNAALTGLMTASNWPNTTAPACASNAAAGGSITAWAMTHAMNAGYWCVDSNGTSASSSVAVATADHKNCAGTAM
jgi:prepilin-type N-terminal cleavage/methylation domain-containing protein